VGLIPLGYILHYGSQAHNWIDLQAQPWLRIGLLTGWLGLAAVIYFIGIRLGGIRWQNFLRHAK
jgi:putative peptidoglycan lipid II flippase